MSGLDNVRNVVGNPMAGIDPLEDYDTRQLWYVLVYIERGRGGEEGGRGKGGVG
jgi:sulfite reductase beta subunit-like hemoprotein